MLELAMWMSCELILHWFVKKLILHFIMWKTLFVDYMNSILIWTCMDFNLCMDFRELFFDVDGYKL